LTCDILQVLGEFCCVLEEIRSLIQFLAVLVCAKRMFISFGRKRATPSHPQKSDLKYFQAIHLLCSEQHNLSFNGA
jgi:hypothetical protein